MFLLLKLKWYLHKKSIHTADISDMINMHNSIHMSVQCEFANEDNHFTCAKNLYNSGGVHGGVDIQNLMDSYIFCSVEIEA